MRGIAASSSRVYASRGASKISAVVPYSTSLPWRMTATRSQRCLTTARSCEISMSEKFMLSRSFLKRVEDLRLDRDIKR